MLRNEASETCKSFGGYLAVISDAQEKAAIQEFLTYLGFTGVDRFYVDGSDAETEGVWKTEAGDVMTYTENSNDGPGENCLTIRTTLFSDYFCTSTLFAVCEM